MADRRTRPSDVRRARSYIAVAPSTTRPRRTAARRYPRHDHTRHDRADPRLLGDPAIVGALEGPLRGAGASRSTRPAYPGFEVEVEALRADPTPIADLTIEAIVEPPRSASSTRSTAADPHGPLRRRRVHAGRDGPRVRLRRRGAQLGPDRGGADDAVDAAALGVPGAQEPAQPPPCRRVRPRAVDVRVHEHLHAGGVAGVLRALPHPGLGRVLFDSVLANFKPGHQDAWVDFKNPNRAPLLFLSGGEDHIMPPSVQASNAEALQGRRHGHRARHLRRAPAPDGRRPGLGGDRRPRARVGRSPTRAGRRPRRADVSTIAPHPHRRARRR